MKYKGEMSSLKFYIIFNILNILLIGFIILCMDISIDLTFDLQGSPGSDIRFLWGLALYITYVTLKLCLPKLIVKSGKKYTKTIINQFVEYLQNNPQNKKKILTLAFCYDLPFLLYTIHLFMHDGIIGAILSIFTLYIISYTGGLLPFYLMLYKEIKNI